MGKYQNPGGLTCSFCHKSQREVDKIIAGPSVYICSECIKLCMDIIRENAPQKPVSWGQDGVPAPAEIKAYLDQYIVGQDDAKRRIAVAVHNHYKRLEANAAAGEGDVEVQKSNVLLVGPTGTGKTLIAQTLARFLDVPFVIADATTLTEAGYVGEDVENMINNLYQAANQSVEKTVRGIVYVDEIDKLARKGFTSSVSRDVSGEGVQQALLKILEGTVASIQSKGKQRMPNQDAVQIDTSNILFICGGSFEGLTSIIGQRLGRRSVGFLRHDVDRADEQGHHDHEDPALLSRVNPEDLVKFGLIPEFIGRLPVVAVMDPLGADDLVHVLTEPKNALVKQYQKLLKFEGVELRFSEGALRAIAERAIARKSGARGLRAVLESVMLDVMFEVPSVDDLREILITEEVVRGTGQPVLRTVPEAGGAS
ncbi:MAG: ATP-dependent Clp protease ATP-binding subunit ClpX [Alphaproteobacteria bacterium]|nr:ATP-dependent Clp protease ATP-binding subunit ClpX [Alphaproteobacteria bacterium]